MRKLLYLGLTIALAVAGTWAGRAAWRAHKNLVSLHVRNLPLADVIRGLERQTWETIATDSRLDAQITLHVRNLPLDEVLNRIAEQTGGLLTTVHAVYDSRGAIETLLAAARRGDMAKAAGWTNLAPRSMALGGPPGLPETKRDPGSGAGPGPKERSVVRMRRDVLVEGGAGDPGGSAPAMRVRAFSGPDGRSVHEEIIEPERIVMESKLKPRLNSDAPLPPTREAASATARQVQGKCITFYTLQQSPIAALVGGALRRLRTEFSGPRLRSKSDLENPPEQPPAPGSAPDSSVNPLISRMEAAEREARRNGLRRFMNLTPEQRARRSREHNQLDAGVNVDVDVRR